MMNVSKQVAVLSILLVSGLGCSDESSDDSSEEAATPCPAGAECLNLDAAADLTAAGLTLQNGGVAIDSTKPRNGGRSLHFTATTGYPGRALVNLTPKSFPSASFHGRAWMFAAQPNASGKNATLIEVVGRATSPLYMNGAPFDTQFRIGVQNAGPLFKAGYETPGWYAMPPSGPHTDCYQHTAAPMPVNQWFCMTWHFDATARKMSIDVNGTNVLQMGETGGGCVGASPSPTLNGTWVYPEKFDYVTLGWAEYEATSGTRELWMDDIATGAAPIACE